MTLANRITLVRLLGIPVFIITLLQGLHPWPVIIFTIIISTDALDGFVARRRHERSPLGAFLDPLADKLLMFSSFLLLTFFLHKIPVWVFVVILSRDILIVLGWMTIYILMGSTEIKPRFLGKLTTILQMITVWLLLLGLPVPAASVFLLATVIATVLSGLDYMVAGSKRLNLNG